MSRRYLFLAVMAAAAVASVARAYAGPEGDKPTLIVLRPAAAPVPALKYQLLPERRSLVAGNAALFYHRATEMSMQQQAADARGDKLTTGSLQSGTMIADWVTGPIASIPRDRVRRLLEANRNSLHEIELGARRRTCEWGFEQREETVDLLIEEIQQMRSLIWLVSLRARMAVLEGNIDGAMHWIQVGFARARHVSEGPLIIQSLVGVHVCQIMCRPLEDLIQAPVRQTFSGHWHTGRAR